MMDKGASKEFSLKGSRKQKVAEPAPAGQEPAEGARASPPAPQQEQQQEHEEQIVQVVGKVSEFGENE